MKQALLDALKGMTIKDAENKVKTEGLACNVLAKGMARIALAVSNTVFLYEDNGIVDHAESGDGCD